MDFCRLTENDVFRLGKENFKKGLTRGNRRGIINDANRKTGSESSKVSDAGVAELADARDLKSRDTRVSYRFDPGHRHHRKKNIAE